MTFTAAPPIPDSSVSEPTFDAQWQAFNNWVANTHVPELNAALPLIESAADASAAAIAVANYKGLWSTLSGPLAIPATVVHSGVRWMLTESVANVAAEVPGVSSKWLSLSATQTYELISTISAAAAATVQWTNFETLASNYSCLRLVASGLIGSAASADLNGQIKISGTFQEATAWQASSAGGEVSGTTLSTPNQLKNTVSKAMALDLNVYALGITQQPAVAFTSLGGQDNVSGNTYPLVGGSCFDVDVAPTTPIQGLRISASTGTISGVFRLYGVRK